MLIPLVFVSIFCVGLGSAVEGIQDEAYNLRPVSFIYSSTGTVFFFNGLSGKYY